MNKRQASRLLTLAWFLKTQVKPRNFKMDTYGWDVFDKLDKPEDGVAPFISRLSQMECGTSACAMGWSAVVFPSKFKIKSLPASMFRGEGKYVVDVKRNITLSYVDFEVKHFFGLTEDESAELFGPYDRTPKQEAKLIEQIVLKHGWTYA